MNLLFTTWITATGFETVVDNLLTLVVLPGIGLEEKDNIITPRLGCT